MIDVDVVTERRLPAAADIVRFGFLGLAIAGLIAAAAFIGGTSADEVSTLVPDLYAGGDAAAFVERLAPGSVPADQIEAFGFAVQQEIDSGSTVAVSELITIDGVTLTRSVADSGISWCVRPDGRLLVSCRFGISEVGETSSDAPIEVAVANVELFADGSVLGIILVGQSEGPYPFGSAPSLVTADGVATGAVLQEALFVSGGQTFPADPAALELPPGVGLLLRYEGSTDPGELTGRTLMLVWDGGTVELEVAAAETWLR